MALLQGAVRMWWLAVLVGVATANNPEAATANNPDAVTVIHELAELGEHHALYNKVGTSWPSAIHRSELKRCSCAARRATTKSS